MKTLLTILLFLLCMDGKGQAFLSDYYWEKTECRCEICGKYIYKWDKLSKSIYPDYGYTPYHGYPRDQINNPIPIDLEAQSIHFKYNIDFICPECKEKYLNKIESRINDIWEIYWENAKMENRSKIKEYDKQKKEQEIQAIEKQIEDLEQQKNILHPESKPRLFIKGNFKSFDTLGSYDSVVIDSNVDYYFGKQPSPKEKLLINPSWQTELLNYWKEYKQECWNDSTWIKTSYDNPVQPKTWVDSLGRKYMDYTGIYFSDALYRERAYWDHRQPIIEGFMEFIERKIK